MFCSAWRRLALHRWPIRRKNLAIVSRPRWRNGAGSCATPTSEPIEHARTRAGMKARLRIAAFATALLLSGAADAQSPYPDRPVKMIAPFAPGGPVDVVPRVLAPTLSQGFGQQFHVTT